MGSTRVLAVATDWPGWCRGGKDDASALQALLAYGPRYTKVVRSAKLGFQAPEDLAQLKITERSKGNAATDYGVPNIVVESDTQPLDEAALGRWQTILKACWRALDKAVEVTGTQPLRVGPRGGGRSLDKIVQHVTESEMGYLSTLGAKPAPADKTDLAHQRQAILKGIVASAHGELPTVGPRGGKRWPARYFVRRAAWHVLDHVWEIEDRRI